MAIDRAAPLLIVALFVLVVPFEKVFPRHGQRLRRPGLGTDLAFGLAQPVLTLLSVFVASASECSAWSGCPGSRCARSCSPCPT
jgi:hypothetical protein